MTDRADVHILVVEDSQTQALRLQYLLEQEGYTVSLCENGRTALASARQQVPALIISDIVMPEMDGYALCRLLKAEQALAEVPVLLVTSLADPEDVLRGLGCGADGFIVKPFDERFLLNRVRYVLLNRKMRTSDRAEMGLNISVQGQNHFITSDRLQILNLLLSTFEAATQKNQELRRSEEALRFANAALSEANRQLREQVRQRELAEAEVLRLSEALLRESAARLQQSEEKLHEQEQLQRLAGRLARVGGWSYRLADRSLYWSEEVALIHGVDPAHVPTIEEALRYYTPESLPAVEAAVHACRTEGTPFNLEAQILRVDGRRVSVRAMGRAIRGADGEIVRVEGALQDVTERDEERERMHQLALRLTRTLETMSDAFFTLDSDWRFTYLNGEAERTLHIDRADALGKNVWEVFPAARGTVFEAAYTKAMQTQTAVTFEAAYPPLAIWVEVRAYPARDGIVVHFSDITERRRKDVERREQALLLDKAKDAILVRDLEHRITFWNAAAERMYGCTREDALGESAVDLIYAADRSQFEVATEAALREGEWTGRLKQRTRDGRELVVEGHWTLLRDDAGMPAAMLSIETDVSEKVQLEQRLAQAQKLESIGKLTGGIAHDFNNFLTVIIGNSELLAEELESDPRLAALAAMVQKAGERGAQLTSQLLAFARKQALDPVLVYPATILDGMQDLLAHTLGSSIELATSQTGTLPPVLADVTQFESALLNLCVNARDAMPDGGRLLIEGSEVKIDRASGQRYVDLPAGEYVCIAVSDTGTGMPADVLANVFEPFFTTKDKGKGTGLGLSMIYGFTKQSGGHVTIYSEPAEGTTVKLYLPKAKGIPVEHDEGDAHAIPAGAGERILLVEDDPLVREHALQLLQSLGYVVVTAVSGPDALALLQADGRFDLLFTDVIMPGGMTGPELARSAHALLPRLPVLFTSGYTEKAIEQQRGGASLNLLHKPYRRRELAQKIRATLSGGATELEGTPP